MKYVFLMWSGFWRKPARTILTTLSIAVAFVLFGLLHGVTSATERAIDQFAANRLSVQSREGLTHLPISHLSKIAQVPNVVGVSPVAWMHGYFRDRKNGLAAQAAGGTSYLSSSEVTVDEQHARAFVRTRSGALADRALAQKYGWKVGDIVPMTSEWRKADGTNVWFFDLVGFYDAPANSLFSGHLWFHYEYFNESRLSAKDTVDSFVVYTTSARHNAEVARTLDRQFENSSHATLTQSEREWVQSGMEQAIDFGLLVKAILGGSFFTLLFVTANTMMESVRQRIPEFGVLKAIGYSNAVILLLVLAECALLHLLGAALGLATSLAFFPLIAPVSSALEPIPMPMSVIVQGAFIAMIGAVVSAAAPALRARRLSIVAALRRA